MNMIKRLISGKSIRRRSLERETAARARRARDHLEKKRDRERTRLARDRARHEISVSRRRALRVLSPVLFVAAFAIGSQIAPLLVEKIWLQTKVIDCVAVQGAVALTPAAIAASAGALAGLPLSQIDPQQVAEQLAADPWIESARALRLPSGTLVVRVVEREAIARWQIGGRTDLIDSEGSRFAGAIEPGGPLPTVEGDTLDQGLLPSEALAILEAVAQHASLTRDSNAIRLHLPGLETDADGILRGSTSGYVLELGAEGPRALLGRRLFSQRVARLASLLDHDEDVIQAAALIDLRFADRAVLRTESTSG